MKYKIIPLKGLKQHEKTMAGHVHEIRESINSERFMKSPIVVDKNTRIILDGHHRYNAALSLGLKRIPVILVDYSSPRIAVYPRRKNIKVTKEIIIQMGQKNRLFPPKTTRHVIPGRKNVRVPLEKLI
jgi:hypothetical protein